jgi:hypothetical protein
MSPQLSLLPGGGGSVGSSASSSASSAVRSIVGAALEGPACVAGASLVRFCGMAAV